jgi:hypothetical protein
MRIATQIPPLPSRITGREGRRGRAGRDGMAMNVNSFTATGGGDKVYKSIAGMKYPFAQIGIRLTLIIH